MSKKQTKNGALLKEYLGRSPGQFFQPAMVPKDLSRHHVAFSLVLGSCINPTPVILDANTGSNFLPETAIRHTDHNNSRYSWVLRKYQFYLNNQSVYYLKCFLSLIY
jgi:hypothetical protein